jgi:uncharacterized membrane protein YciS (DUF1049 family)
MKFCPRCGEMLDDNALICPRCGASQSGQSNLDSINRPTPNQNIQNVSKQHIEISDEKFNRLRKLLMLRNLAMLLGLLTIVSALLVFFSNMFVFTGVNAVVSSVSKDPFNFIGLYKYNDTASSVENAAWNVGPSSITTMMSVVPVVGFFVPVVFGLVGLLMMIPGKKEVMYQAYLQKPEALPKTISNVGIFAMMYVGAILPIIGLIICRSTMNNLTYNYGSDSKYYAYGEMALNNSTFTVALILAIIFAVIVIAGSILYTLLFIKSKVKEVTEN